MIPVVKSVVLFRQSAWDRFGGRTLREINVRVSRSDASYVVCIGGHAGSADAACRCLGLRLPLVPGKD